MRVGTVCYATDQGIAHLAKWFFDAGVIQDVMVFRHGSRTTHAEWYPGAVELVQRPFNGPVVDAFLSNVGVMLFFETPFDWAFIPYCRERGVRTVICPMYECAPRKVPYPPDKWICPSPLDCEYFPGSPFVPVPVNVPWQRRDRALRFLHNGGHLGLRGHKGTLELLQAVRYVKSPILLTVRSQDAPGLHRLLRQTPWVKDDPRVTITTGTLPYGTLFDDHDVLVAPEKYNGLSLPLQEAYASGMLVMTSDRFPHNTWLPKEPLIPVAGYSEQCVGPSYNLYQEARIEPEAVAAKIDAWWGKDITEYSYSGKHWAVENSWEVLKPRWLQELSK